MKKTLPILILILLGFCCRLLPHAPNFTPIGAIAIFAGLYLPKRWAIIAPLCAMFISDFFVGFYDLPIMLSVYASFAIMGGIGLLIRRNVKFSTVLDGTILGSILFFLITNFTVWQFGTMYEHNLQGLIHCYAMALPFFRNSLFGDLFYTGVLVGGYEFCKLLVEKKIAVKI